MVEIKSGNAEGGFTEIVMDEKLATESFVLKGAYNLLMKLKNTSED